MQCPISITVSTNNVLNLLHEVDESVPILEYFNAIPCIINEVVKVTEEAEAVFLRVAEKDTLSLEDEATIPLKSSNISSCF